MFIPVPKDSNPMFPSPMALFSSPPDFPSILRSPIPSHPNENIGPILEFLMLPPPVA